MNYTWEVIKITTVLLFVLGLIYLIAYLMKNKMTVQKGQYINVLERVYISPKVNLSLIKASDRVLLISISGDNVRLLESWPAEDFIEHEVVENKSFRDYIQTFIDKPGSFFNGRDNNDKK